jgi:hypothetical protein
MDITKEQAINYSLIFVIIILIIVVLYSFKSNENYRRIDMPKIPTSEELLNYLGLTKSGSSENFEFSLTNLGEYVQSNPFSPISEFLKKYGIEAIQPQAIINSPTSEHFVTSNDINTIYNNVKDELKNVGKKLGF